MVLVLICLVWCGVQYVLIVCVSVCVQLLYILRSTAVREQLKQVHVVAGCMQTINCCYLNVLFANMALAVCAVSSHTCSLDTCARECLCPSHKATQLQWNKADESQLHSSVSPRGRWLTPAYCCESTTLSESTVPLFPPFPNSPCHPALLPTPTHLHPHTHTHTHPLKAVSCHSLRAGASVAQQHPQGSEAVDRHQINRWVSTFCSATARWCPALIIMGRYN